MRMHNAVFVSGFVGIAGLLLFVACGDDESKTEPIRSARKGEACQTTNDCAPGLACTPGPLGSGVCVLGSFTVAQTAKECAVTECTTAADCCGPPSPSCTEYASRCADAGGDTTNAFCQLFQTQCVCANRDCENSKCIQKCDTNTQCGGGRTCAGGKCVQCSSDDQCGGAGSTLKCVSGECQGPCQGDGDCPGFERCINQQCTDGACQTNRECVAATRNVEATCGTNDGKCIVPCTTDLECGSPRDFRFYSCVSNKCLFLGCETDKDCRLILEGLAGTSSSSGGSSGASSGTTSSGSSGSFAPSRHIVCRDKSTPGNTIIPAR